MTVSRPVFVVMGSCGEYSDSREWIVGYALTHEAADAHAKKLAEVYRDDKAEYDADEGCDKDYEHIRRLDPGFSSSYTGTEYAVILVDPLEAVSS